MSEVQKYPKRLIEGDFPIREVSQHARREKSIRHGHISTLHIWWARRPLAACRAVLCATLWPDPTDPHCSWLFCSDAISALTSFYAQAQNQKPLFELLGSALSSLKKLSDANDSRDSEDARRRLRDAMNSFLSAFSNWDASSSNAFIEAARKIVNAASGVVGTLEGGPNIMDPFSGGGSIPLESLRLGARTFASDLNPVAVLLERVTLDYLPRLGTKLAPQIRKWGQRLSQEAESELGDLYPKGPYGGAPIAYLMARTIRCEGPACGAEFPLMQSTSLARRGKRQISLTARIDAKMKSVSYGVREDGAKEKPAEPTIRKGHATCPVCGYVTVKDRMRAQLRDRAGGVRDAKIVCVIDEPKTGSGKIYREPRQADHNALAEAGRRFGLRSNQTLVNGCTALPDELIPSVKVWKNNPIRVHLYGMKTWGDLFSQRQALVLMTLIEKLHSLESEVRAELSDDLSRATLTCLALVIGRQVDRMSSLCFWHSIRETLEHTFSRHSLSMVPCFPEANPFCNSTGSFANSIEWTALVAEAATQLMPDVQVNMAPASKLPFMPDDSCDVVFTDPPYYDAVPYGEISDYFYVWLRRAIGHLHPELFVTSTVDKTDECVFNPEAISRNGKKKDGVFFQSAMTDALREARRIVTPQGIGVVVFAHKTTAGWEAQLQAMIDAGWVITASWPLDTELATRLRAQGSAALASSIHLVCRPREDRNGNLTDQVGEWKLVVSELPLRLRTWMSKLTAEGVVGADAIFACLGPALEIFSQYSRVERASGEQVRLGEYLEQVWAAVSTAALAQMFDDADAAGLEDDARVTAMWLWTIFGGARTGPADDGGTLLSSDESADGEEDEDDETSSKGKSQGWPLEYDAARKIAQGLGAKLEALTHLVEVTGKKSRLLSVGERMKYLFGKSDVAPTTAKKFSKKKQMTLFGEIETSAEAQGWGEIGAPMAGSTTLDRVHQAMLLFGSGRAEALKRFLVEDGAGKQAQFWKLAQSLSALYPGSSDEKRWVDGVLVRKKGLGFG